MKISETALPLLILAAALGRPAHASLQRGPRGYVVKHHSDCCYSYAPRDIRCTLITDYYVTGKLCSKSAVIFITKRKQAICVDHHRQSVKRCMEHLDSAKKWANTSAKEKPQ